MAFERGSGTSIRRAAVVNFAVRGTIDVMLRVVLSLTATGCSSWAVAVSCERVIDSDLNLLGRSDGEVVSVFQREMVLVEVPSSVVVIVSVDVIVAVGKHEQLIVSNSQVGVVFEQLEAFELPT